MKDWKELKKEYSLEKLRQIQNTSEQLIPELNRYVRLSNDEDEKYQEYKNKLKDLKEELPEIEKAIEFYNFDPDSELSETEEEVIRALKTSALGREGLIFKEMFAFGEGYEAMKTLMLRGIVVDIDPHHHFSHLPNHDHIGLAGEEYPTNDEEWSNFRDSGASEEMSYGDFKKKMENNEVEWTSDKINKVLNDDVQKAFQKRIKGDLYWLNIVGKVNDLHKAKELVREGKSGEEILEQMLIEHLSTKDAALHLTNSGIETEWSTSGEKSEIIDMDWWNDIIDKRREYLQEQLETLEK